MKDVVPKDKCQISNELQLHQAFTRRALACDLMQVCTYREMERWHRHLLDQMQSPAPPGFRPPNMEQILRTDLAGWVKMAERLLSLKRKADGTLPLGQALTALQSDPSVMFHLVPLPIEKGTTQPKTAAPKADDAAPKPSNVKKKRQAEAGQRPRQGCKGQTLCQGEDANRIDRIAPAGQIRPSHVLQLQHAQGLRSGHSRPVMPEGNAQLYEMFWCAPSVPMHHGLTTDGRARAPTATLAMCCHRSRCETPA